MKKVFSLTLVFWLISIYSFSQPWDAQGNSISAADFLGTTNNMPVEIKTYGVQSMFIDATGNVGIGNSFNAATYPPASLSHIANWTAGRGVFQLFNQAKTGFGNEYGFLVGMGNTSNDAVLAAQSGDINLYTSNGGTSSPYPPDPANGNLRMVIKRNTGRVGIGTETPIQKLDIDGRINIREGVIQKGSPAITTTVDLGLYSLDTHTWMRFVTNQQPIKFFTDANTNPIGQDESMSIESDGKVLIGKPSWVSGNTLDLKLVVKGGILCEKVKVALDNGGGNWSWPDYVFSSNYKLKTLNEIEEFIKINNHLPDLPSSCDVEENGIDLAQMNAKLLEKIEELTLYLIAQDKEIENLKEVITRNK